MLSYAALIDDDGLPVDPHHVRVERRQASRQRPARPGKYRPTPQSLPPAKPLVRDSSVQSTNSSDDVDDDSDYAGNAPQKKVKVSTNNRNTAADLPVNANSKVALKASRTSEESGC